MLPNGITFAFNTTDRAATIAALQAEGWTPRLPPAELSVDHEQVDVGTDWLRRAIAAKRVVASWENRVDRLILRDDCAIVCGEREGLALSIDRMLAFLETVPFTLASFGAIQDWPDEFTAGFGDFHDQHGWGCAFKGMGHERLVSRRWLAVGPWRVLRGPDDLSLVQFHDLAADAATSYEQAKRAHRVMGIDKLGGFLQTRYQYRTDLKGLYSTAQRALIFVIKGRELTPYELRDAAAARRFQPFGADHPIDRVVYVFVDRAEAERHLPILWRYGHEVRLIGDDGIERRIDEDFVPTLDKPAWVRQLERDDSAALLDA